MIGKHIFERRSYFLYIWKINNIYNLPWSNKALTLLNKKKAHPSIFQNYFKGGKKQNCIQKILGIYLYKWWKGWFNKVGEIDIASKNHTLFMCLRSFTFIYSIFLRVINRYISKQKRLNIFFIFTWLKKYINTV